MLDLEAIKARCEAATPGPWELKESQVAPTYYVFGSHSHIATMNGERDFYSNTKPDAIFIAAARTDIPALIAEVEKLREELEQARAGIDMAYNAAKGATREACALVCEKRSEWWFNFARDMRSSPVNSEAWHIASCMGREVLWCASLIRAGGGIISSDR